MYTQMFIYVHVAEAIEQETLAYRPSSLVVISCPTGICSVKYTVIHFTIIMIMMMNSLTIV